ncbi:MAG: oligosaccharide flippase family protein [Actinomycetota bacterium]|nr:oligosaccharide flippase family protein [Actinomycetota bacterium]
MNEHRHEDLGAATTSPGADADAALGGLPEASDTIVRGSVLAFAAQAVGGLSTGALTVFLARRLGSAGFGVFSLALSIETLLLLVSDLGVIQALQRFVAENRHDRSAVGAVVGDAIRLKLMSSLAGAAALAALADVVAHAYGSPKLGLTLRGIALDLVGMNFLLMFAGVFTAMRVQAMTLTAFFLESMVELTASVVLVLTLGGAAAAAFGRAIGYLCGAAAGLALTVRLAGPGVLARIWRPRGNMRRIAGDAGPLLIVNGAYTLFTQIDSLLIAAFLSVTSVGVWQAPLRLVVLMVYPGQAIGSAVSPRLARSDGGVEPGSFTQAIRVVMVLMAAMTAVSVAWATPIISLTLGSAFRGSAGVLRGLGPFIFLSGLGPLVSVGMNYLGAARRRIPIAIATVLLNLIVDLILIPRIGVLGGALGTDAALLLYVPAHFLYCQRALNIPLTPSAKTLGRSLLAGGAMALVLAAFGTRNLSVPEVLGGAALGTSAFAAVLLISRELTLRELLLLWLWIKRRASRPSRARSHNASGSRRDR